MIEFTIPGKLKSVQSVRACIRGGRIHYFQDAKTVQWKAFVKKCVAHADGLQSLDGPLWTEIVYHAPRPKYLQHEASGLYAPVYPDVDNCLKGIHDGIEDGGLVYEDDRFICRTLISKVYAEYGEEPYTEMRIGELEDV